MEPRENPLLFGHDEAERAFTDAHARGRLHHAWLLLGPDGVGKATLAFRLARLLLTQTGDPHDPANPVFRRVARATHADLLTVEREWDDRRKRLRTDIVVEDARDIAGFLRLTPAEAGWRVVVVDGAEHLNRNAANALLKVLEEPPARAILLLACAAPGRLLPTIRSRCRRLELRPLAPDAMDRAVTTLLPEVEPGQRAGLLALAEGAPGRAARLIQDEALAVAGLVDEVLAASSSISPARAWEVSDKVARTDALFATFMDLLRRRLAASLRSAARGAPDRLASLRPLGEWSEVWHALGRLQDETERANLDKRHAVVAGLDLLNAS